MNWDFNKFNNKIINKVDISDILREYLILQKKGKDFIAVCPFHDDNNPSLFISKTKQIFKCFSCGVGGTALKFVVMFENVSFSKAYKMIVKKFNLEIDDELIEDISFNEEQQKKIEILKEIHNYYKFKILSPTKELESFLIKRNINDEIIRKYELGWAPINGNEILEFLIKKGFSENELLKTDFFNFKNENELSDYFRGRFLFPLKDENNILIGFSGRSIDLNKFQYSKFLISRDSNIFNKKKVLFNFFNIKKKYKNIKIIYIVEGFLDSIRLTELNYPSIAILGTELFDEQIGIIKESFEKVIIIPDGDDPGIISSVDNALKLRKFNIKSFIFNHKTNLDPDILFKEKPKILEKKSLDILNPIDFLMYHFKLFLNKENKKIFLNRITEFLRLLSEIDRDLWLKKIEKTLKIPYRIFKKQLEKNNIKTKNYKNNSKNNSKTLDSEELLLSCLFFFKELRQKFIEFNFFLIKKENKEIFSIISKIFDINENLNIEEVLEKKELKLYKEKIIFLKNNLLIKMIIESNKFEKYKIFNELLNKIKNKNIDFKLKIIKEKISKNNDISLFLKYSKLTKQKEKKIFFK